VEDGLIVSVGDAGGGVSGADVVRCEDYIVMPGLVNAHTHTPMTIMRGFRDDLELGDWLSNMWRVERELTPALVSLGSELAVMEMLSTGTTAFVDMYFYPEATAEVASRYGIRCMLGPPFIDVMENPEVTEARLINFYSTYRDHELVKPLINVHSIYACSRETLERVREISNRLPLNVHMHVSETRDEVYEIKKRVGKFPIEYLKDVGLVSNRLHLVHLGWVTSWELSIIRESGAKVTYSPTSNMKLATAGFFPMKELVELGVTVTLGTDGPASNNSLDMFREMKTGVLLQRHSYWDTKVGAMDMLRAATLSGYRLMGIRGGSIEPGYVADMVLINVRKPHLQPLRLDNIVSTLVYSASGMDVDMTIIGGRIVYIKDKDWARFSERAMIISEELNKFMERFLER